MTFFRLDQRSSQAEVFAWLRAQLGGKFKSVIGSGTTI
jgi:hypothetical protein